jgi:hypothetical protein
MTDELLTADWPRYYMSLDGDPFAAGFLKIGTKPADGNNRICPRDLSKLCPNVLLCWRPKTSACGKRCSCCPTGCESSGILSASDAVHEAYEAVVASLTQEPQ